MVSAQTEVSDGTKICWGLCNQVFVVLFRRSTGRQRNLVPTPVTPLFDVVLLCCAVGGLLRHAIWVWLRVCVTPGS